MLLFPLVFAVSLCVFMLCLINGISFKKRPVVTEGNTEALEAWLDRYNEVLDPFASIEEIDELIFKALKTADGPTPVKTQGIRTGPQYAKAPAQKSRKYKCSCSTCGTDGLDRPECFICGRTTMKYPGLAKGNTGTVEVDYTNDLVTLQWQGMVQTLTTHQYQNDGSLSAREWFMCYRPERNVLNGRFPVEVIGHRPQPVLPNPYMPKDMQDLQKTLRGY